MITYEERLNRDLDWALREGGMHFREDNDVHRTLKRIAERLDGLGIPYAIVGGMAMYLHGYRRFTEDVDLLVNRAGLEELHRQLEGLGYLPPFAGSKQLRDTDSGVRVEFLVSGEYPGDGKPKPVVFPDPAGATVEIGGYRVLALPRLVELKLASGLSNPRRAKDLVDVQSLIEALQLPESFADKLDPSVRDKFRELFAVIRDNPP